MLSRSRFNTLALATLIGFCACGTGYAQVTVTQYSSFADNGPGRIVGIINPQNATSGIYSSELGTAIGSVDSLSTPEVSSNIVQGTGLYISAKSIGELEYRFEVEGAPNSFIPVSFIGKSNLYAQVGQSEVDSIFTVVARSGFSIFSELQSFGNNVGTQLRVSNFSGPSGFLGFTDSGAVASRIEATTQGTRGSFIELSTSEGDIRSGGGSQPPLLSNSLAVNSGDVNALERFNVSFSGTVLIATNGEGLGTGLVNLQAYTIAQSLDTLSKGSALASSYIDPYLYIDPTYLTSNSRTVLRMLDGVGNEPISPVPELTALEYMGLGCLLLCLQGRFRRDKRSSDYIRV